MTALVWLVSKFNFGWTEKLTKTFEPLLLSENVVLNRQKKNKNRKINTFFASLWI